MKAYFSASSDVGDSKKLFYKKVLKFLESNSLEVSQSIFSNISQKSLRKSDDFFDVYNDVLKKIDESDVLVADISDPSGGVGYQVYHAINSKKPIIIIYSNNGSSNPSVIIRGIKSKKVIIIDFDTFEDLKGKLQKAVNYAIGQIKVRFNLVMNSTDYSFIEQESKKLGISKTKYILKIIKQAKINSRQNS